MKTSLSPENLQKLFLFEIYVESLKIDYPKLCFTQNCLDSLKESVIRFQFLGFKPIEIREDEFAKIPEKQDCGEKPVLTGKSCLFSLRDLPNEIRYVEVDVTVMRMTESGKELTLGRSSIRLGENFAEILKTRKPNSFSTSVKKPFKLFDQKCREIGNLCVAINLSCFGKMITTSFQLDGEDSKAYVVQPGGEVPMREIIQSDASYESGVCPGKFIFGKPLTGGSPQTGQRILGGSPNYQGLMGGSPIVRFNDTPMVQQVCNAQMNSSAGASSSSDEENPQMPFQFCGCDYPIPPELQNAAAPRKKKKKKKKAVCPLSSMKDFCMNPDCPKGYPQLPFIEERHKVCYAMSVIPGTMGLKGEQVLFQLPTENQPLPGNKRATFKFGGGIDNNLNDVRIMKDSETKGYELSNNKNDIFVMKVGKINQETDKRHNMVLEIKQPKTPVDEREYLDIRTQYAETDFTAGVPKKKGGKKEKKGKKGKKGGKKGKKKK